MEIESETLEPKCRDMVPAGFDRDEYEVLDAALPSAELVKAELDAEISGFKESFIKEHLHGAEPKRPSPTKDVKKLLGQLTSAKIGRNLDRLLDKALELAEGIWVEQVYVTKKGEEHRKVYKRPPDFFAIQYLVNRELGSPVQMTKGGAPAPVQIVAVSVGVDASPAAISVGAKGTAESA